MSSDVLAACAPPSRSLLSLPSPDRPRDEGAGERAAVACRACSASAAFLALSRFVSASSIRASMPSMDDSSSSIAISSSVFDMAVEPGRPGVVAGDEAAAVPKGGGAARAEEEGMAGGMAGGAVVAGLGGITGGGGIGGGGWAGDDDGRAAGGGGACVNGGKAGGERGLAPAAEAGGAGAAAAGANGAGAGGGGSAAAGAGVEAA